MDIEPTLLDLKEEVRKMGQAKGSVWIFIVCMKIMPELLQTHPELHNQCKKVIIQIFDRWAASPTHVSKHRAMTSSLSSQIGLYQKVKMVKLDTRKKSLCEQNKPLFVL